MDNSKKLCRRSDYGEGDEREGNDRKGDKRKGNDGKGDERKGNERKGNKGGRRVGKKKRDRCAGKSGKWVIKRG